MPPIIHRFLLTVSVLIPLLLVPDAHAVVLGEIRSAARLGELLHAEIDVEEEAADRFDTSCVKLYRPAQVSTDLPWVTEARLSFRHENGKGKLYISSDHPMLEPVVQIGIFSSCAGGRVWRDYTVLLSPRTSSNGDRPGKVDTRSKQLPVAPVSKVDRVAWARDFVAGEPVLRLTAWDSTRPTRVQHTLVSGAISNEVELSLRMSVDLASGQAGASTELSRDLLRLEYRLLTMLHEQVDKQLSLAENLRQMERSENGLNAAASHLGATRSVTVDAAPAVVSPPVAAEPVAPRPIPKAGPEAPPAEDAGASVDEFVYLGMGGVLLLVLIVIISRSRRRVDVAPEALLPMHAPTVVVEDPEFSQPPGPAVAVQVTDEMATGAQSAESRAVSLEIPPAPENQEVTPVMELAEIMLSFGRVNGAAQALQEYIEANPKVALQPWMRLLEIYRENGMRVEFEGLATNLHQNFNVEIVHWEAAVPGERVEMSLELLPHIRDQIDALWGKPECFEYLQQLLRDNRDGGRTGFTLPVVKEILLLIDLMVAEKAATNK
jgi:hypothetical protein